MQALWKQDHQLHPTFEKINRCLHEDWFLLPHELKLQRAHARALEDAGILSADEFARVCAALEEIDTAHTGPDCPQSDAEDLHTWIESELTAMGRQGSQLF